MRQGYLANKWREIGSFIHFMHFIEYKKHKHRIKTVRSHLNIKLPNYDHTKLLRYGGKKNKTRYFIYLLMNSI